MKLKNVIISEANGEYVAVNVGGEFNGMVKLNDTAAFIAKQMEDETTIDLIVEKICKEYEIDEQTAEESVLKIVNQFKEIDFIEM